MPHGTRRLHACLTICTESVQLSPRPHAPLCVGRDQPGRCETRSDPSAPSARGTCHVTSSRMFYLLSISPNINMNATWMQQACKCNATS
eukprot:272721-Pleurochrysis_carterae.AAC.2